MSIYDEFMSMNWADVDDKPTIIDDSFNSVLRKHQDPVDFKKLAEDSQDGFNLLLKSVRGIACMQSRHVMAT